MDAEQRGRSNRTRILSALADYVSNGLGAVVQPDLPNLLVGPDVLFGHAGSLIAAFFPTVREIQDPDQLLIRLFFSRLALPSHLRSVLAIDPDASTTRRRLGGPFARIDDIADLFDVVLINRSARQYERAHEASAQPIAEPLRQRVAVRAARLYEASLRHLAAPTEELRREEIIPSRLVFPVEVPPFSRRFPFWSPQPTRPELYFLENQILGSLATTRQRNPSERLRQLCITSMQVDFELSGSGLQVRGESFDQMKVLVADRMPPSPSDPLKPFRAAALAGWVVRQTQPNPELAEFARQVIEHWGGDDEA